MSVMVVARECHQRLSPQFAHHLDLLLEHVRARAEVGAERLVLCPVPSNSDRQSQSSTTEQIDRRHLLRNHRRLALGQDHHTGHEFESCGDPSEMTEEHEDLVEGVLIGVRRRAEAAEVARGQALRRRPEKVIVGHQMVVTDRLQTLRVAPDRRCVGAGIGLREDRPDSHRPPVVERAMRAVRTRVCNSTTGLR